jgi:hypothetical protein
MNFKSFKVKTLKNLIKIFEGTGRLFENDIADFQIHAYPAYPEYRQAGGRQGRQAKSSILNPKLPDRMFVGLVLEIKPT